LRRECRAHPAHPTVERIDGCLFGLSRGIGSDRPTGTVVLGTVCRRADAAFGLLERDVRERDPLAVQRPLEPTFETLAADPRWRTLLNRLGCRRRRR